MLESISPIRAIGEFFTFLGECTLILLDAVRRLFKRPREIGETLKQISFVGAASIPIVALTTFFSGAVLALYSSELLVQYGAGSLAGGTIGLAVCREIAPVLAGIMVSARCGSAMAAQIGTMVVTEQVDALRALSVHPTNYLVIPRIAACVVAVPILCMVGIYAGVAGGYLVSVSNGVPAGSFVVSIRQFVEPWDFLGGLIKSLAFGSIISIVACQQGLRASNGAVGVGRATTNAVVISMVLVYIANYVLAAFLY
jgi:phospholipid/cholesterol/gamma-HCH transport system permease protein